MVKKVTELLPQVRVKADFFLFSRSSNIDISAVPRATSDFFPINLIFDEFDGADRKMGGFHVSFRDWRILSICGLVDFQKNSSHSNKIDPI